MITYIVQMLKRLKRGAFTKWMVGHYTVESDGSDFFGQGNRLIYAKE
jgi:hypothetical protein